MLQELQAIWWSRNTRWVNAAALCYLRPTSQMGLQSLQEKKGKEARVLKSRQGSIYASHLLLSHPSPASASHTSLSHTTHTTDNSRTENTPYSKLQNPQLYRQVL